MNTHAQVFSVNMKKQQKEKTIALSEDLVNAKTTISNLDLSDNNANAAC